MPGAQPALCSATRLPFVGAGGAMPCTLQWGCSLRSQFHVPSWSGQRVAFCTLHCIRRWRLDCSGCNLPEGNVTARVQDLAPTLVFHWHFQLRGRIAVLRRQRPALATSARREGVIFGPSRSGLGLWAGTIGYRLQFLSLLKGDGRGQR